MKELIAVSMLVISFYVNAKVVTETKWKVNIPEGNPVAIAKYGGHAIATYLPSIGVVSFYDQTRECKDSDIFGKSVWKINGTNVRMLPHCVHDHVLFTPLSEAGNKFVIDEFSQKKEVNTPIATYSASGFLKEIIESKNKKAPKQFADYFLGLCCVKE
ncbi:hypothetical protein P7M58_23225 [Vibrio parahaemolyticus]|nr:hypothetical protein [Vibrio parahaemolyticus]MDG2997270.1 hypothetical protein [Vibrio parahaemolyticus]